MYHMVCPSRPGTRFNGMRVPPRAFERQLEWLSHRRFHFVTMSELSASAVPERSVALTFDDGFEDNYTAAFPLLKRFQAKATLYAVVSRNQRTDWSARKKAHHSDGELLREPKLSDDQIQEMVASGIFELGAHTMTHVNLAQATEAEKAQEICGSKRALEDRFGVNVRSFAYPFGIWRAEDREVVARAGFTTAVTTEQGIDRLPYDDPLALRRIKVSGREGHYAFKLRVRSGRRSLWK